MGKQIKWVYFRGVIRYPPGSQKFVLICAWFYHLFNVQATFNQKRGLARIQCRLSLSFEGQLRHGLFDGGILKLKARGESFLGLHFGSTQNQGSPLLSKDCVDHKFGNAEEARTMEGFGKGLAKEEVIIICYFDMAGFPTLLNSKLVAISGATALTTPGSGFSMMY